MGHYWCSLGEGGVPGKLVNLLGLVEQHLTVMTSLCASDQHLKQNDRSTKSTKVPRLSALFVALLVAEVGKVKSNKDEALNDESL
jgi:hypothetical protein